MATQAENKAIAESFLVTGSEVVEKLRKVADIRKRLEKEGQELEEWDSVGRTRHNHAHADLTRIMDERGKQLMGIWAQAQVYATLATVPDNLPEAWTPVTKAPDPADKAIGALDWMHRQAQSNFPSARVRVRKIFDQDETEIYEIRVDEKGEITRYSFVPDYHAEDPYHLPPSEQWKRF